MSAPSLRSLTRFNLTMSNKQSLNKPVKNLKAVTCSKKIFFCKSINIPRGHKHIMDRLAATCILISFVVLTSAGDIGTGVTRLTQDAIARRNHRRQAKESALFRKSKHPDNLLQQTRHSVQSATNPQDKKALEDFYRSTDGAQWTNNSKWMKGDPCQDGWYGIYCSQGGRVLELALVYNLLSGPLPDSITDLDNLQTILLYSNDINGSIPAGVFSMSSLQTLDLNNNAISGTLPSTISMGDLTVLNLYSNKIHGEVPKTWNTPNLETLSFSSNMLTGTLPPGIGKLSKLKSLVLSRNKLSGKFPEEYGNLLNLEMLWLFSNDFNKPELPESWSRLTSLTDVELDGLSGEFPSWISKWENVFNLVIVDGYLTGPFPVSLCSLKKIQYLHIFNNSLSGPLPDCICDFPMTLISLEISDNDFSGPIPSCIGNLRNLTELYMSRNNLSGHLPKSLGDIHGLGIVDLSSNSIVGSVPSSYAGLNGGTFGFSLCYNKLSSFESGLEKFFDFIKGYTCALYENPWNCPLPSYIPKDCQAECSRCNTGSKQTTCSTCVADSSCGWCSEGPNCLEGTQRGPESVYRCEKSNWFYGSGCLD